MNGEVGDFLPERAIGVVGMSGRFPGAPTIEQYWANLRAGVCSLREFSREELLADGVDSTLLDRPDYVPAKGYLEDADRFEAELFGFTRREAALLDPQHRLLLETAWGALEDAGRDPLDVGVRTGVYVGGGTSEHMIAALSDPATGADLGALNVRLLTDKDFLASWISYRLGLDGPAMAVQTACSTSLTAVHVAGQALLLGECDLALAGGVAIDSIRREGYVYQSGAIMSRDGRCRPFSAAADGTVRGNGVGLVALRRLEDAVAEGDPIHAVIRGTAAVNDGGDKIGFTAPGERGQFTAMTEALSAADLDPAAIDYIEMHGTATALGDRIEVAATSAAYAGAARVGIGSVKSNLGHLDAAAGIAGLIKAALMVRHGEFVPTVNVQGANPDLALDSTPLRIVEAGGPWTTPDGSPRRAGVSSVGLGGSNVHIILEQAPDSAPDSAPAGTTGRVLLPISARTAEQATAAAHALADTLEQHPDLDLGAVAATLQRGRARLAHRGYVVAASRAEAVAGLRSLVTHEATTAAGGALFVFPGQASQYIGMGRELHERFPVFRDALDRCAKILRASHRIDPRSWLDTAAEHIKAGTRGATEYWQPTIVSIEYAAAELLRSRGVEPAAMVGHSIGEYVAAHLAGVFSLEDALRLVAERGRLMAATPAGAMLAVRAPATEVAALAEAFDVDLAAVNGRDSCVFAGAPAAVEQLVASLTAQRILHRDLGVGYGFHSRLMDDVLNEFREIVAKVSLAAPTGRYVSTVSGNWITPDQATDPAFWTEQIRRPVRFADAIREAGAAAGPIVEAGPRAGLAEQAMRTLGGRPAFTLLGRRGMEEAGALTTFGGLWLYDDVPVALSDPTGDEATPRRVHLPGYRFVGMSYGALSLRPSPARIPDPETPPTAVVADLPAADRVAIPARDLDDDLRRDLSGVEERIAELLRSTLGVSEPEDREVSYLAAGGESLTAVHLVGRLREDFGLEVPIALLLEPIPLRALAKRIAAEGQPPDDGMLVSLLGELEAESGTGPLTGRQPPA